MTDLIHAQENKLVDRLNVIYLLSIIGGVSSTLLNHHELLDILFIISSVVHFKNDFPFKNKYLQMISSSVFISQLGHINLTWFFAYMFQITICGLETLLINIGLNLSHIFLV